MRGLDCKHDRLSVQKQESGPVVRIRITLPYGLAGFTECIMDVAAVAYYSLVELSHKKRGSYVAGLTDVDKKVADTSFPERPLEAIDSFRSRMTEASLAGGQVLFLVATQPRKVSVLVSAVHPRPILRIVAYIDGRDEVNLSASVKNIYDGSRKGQRQSSSMMFSGSHMRSIMSRATVIPDSAAEERRS